MEIKTSVDWSKIDMSLRRQARGLAYEKDISKMITNIRPKITLLSKAEVEARRGSKWKAEELLKEVNADIETIEEFLLVAALLG